MSLPGSKIITWLAPQEDTYTVVLLSVISRVSAGFLVWMCEHAEWISAVHHSRETLLRKYKKWSKDIHLGTQ